MLHNIGLDTSDGSIVTIADTTNNTNATLTSEITGDEDGATVTYTMTLDKAPTTNETFTFKVDGVEKTIIVEAGKTTGTTTVTFTESDVFKDTDTIPKATDLKASDVDGASNYEQLTLVNNSKDETVVDSIDTTTVTITAAKVTEKVITKDNFENNAGFKVYAKNADGSEGVVAKNGNPSGFGVANKDGSGQNANISGAPSEIGMTKDGRSESIEVVFKNPVHELNVAFAWRATQESAKVDFYDENGKKVGHATIFGGNGSEGSTTIQYYNEKGEPVGEPQKVQGGSDNVDKVYTFKPVGDVTFTKAVFSAIDNGKDFGQQSDYLIHSISYKEVIDEGNTTIVGRDEVAFKIATSNIPDPSKYDFIKTFPTAVVKIVDKNSDEVLFNKTVNLDKDGKAIVTVRTDGTKDLIAEVSNVQGNFEEVDYKNAKTEVEASIKATASNDSFDTLEDTNYVLKTTDFGDNNQNVAKIKFDSVPANGTIYVLKSEYTGSMNDRAEYTSSENKVYIGVKAGDIVDISKINSGSVVFVPKENSDKNGSFNFSVSNGKGNFSGNYTTTIDVKAVADAPTVSISITPSSDNSTSTGNGGNGNSGSGTTSFDKVILTQTVESSNNNQNSSIDRSSSTTNEDFTFGNINGGTKTIKTGSGNDEIKVDGSINGITISTGSGDDYIKTDRSADNTDFDLGDGNDTVEIYENFSGTIEAGAGDDRIIIGKNVNSNSVINTGSGNDYVQINSEIANNAKINLGDGNDGIRILQPTWNTGNTEAVNGGRGFDTLYLNGNHDKYLVYIKSTDAWVKDVNYDIKSTPFNNKNYHVISWETYAKLNEDANGEANREFYIMKVSDGMSDNKSLKVTNFESISFDDKTFGEKEETSTVYKYDIALNIKLTDTDGSEKLSDVTIKNIPNGSKLFGADGKEINAKDNGTYTVKVGENGEAKLSLTSESEISDTDLNSIKASATSTENSNGDSATTTVSQKLGNDIDLSGLKSILKEQETGDINLSNNSQDKLTLTLGDVLELSDDGKIKITGDMFDSVAFKNEDGKAWKQETSITENNKTFDVYSGSIGDQTVQVKVEQPISDGITN